MNPVQLGLLKFLAAVVAIALSVGLLVGGAVLLLAKAAGMGQSFGPGAAQGGAAPLASPLPTKALPVPHSSSGSAVPTPHRTRHGASTRLPKPHGSIILTATPDHVSPSGKIYLNGSWPGHSGVSLAIENSAGGTFSSFSGLTVSVTSGTFTTYVMTSRPGIARFRVKDPATGATSNVVQVRVG